MKPVALITGAGRGIGRATAITLASRGYDLVLVSRTIAELEETRKLAGGGTAIAADVSDAPAVKLAVEKAMHQFGRIDACVHAAGVAPLAAIEQITDAKWRETIDTNLSSAFYLCRAVWPIWKSQKSGCGVLLSSQAARDPFPGLSIYGAAKAGLNLLALALANEGAAYGIRMHAVAPGATETAMLRKIASKQQLPTENTMAPEEVAQVIAACVAGEMKYASGETVYLKKR